MSLASVDAVNFQQLSTVHSEAMPKPPTVASASDIGDTIQNFLTIISGTTAIDTITPPINAVHMICLVFTNANPGGVTTGGNIANAVDPAQYVPVLLIYNPLTATYYAK